MLPTLIDDTMEIKGKEEASVFVYDWINQVISRDPLITLYLLLDDIPPLNLTEIETKIVCTGK